MNGSGCKNCPVNHCETMNYRGSTCAAQRAKFGLGDPKTNADRIRAMSDEKLAKWMSCGATMSVGVCGYCKNSKLASCDGIPCEEKTDAEIILEWLKQPAEAE